MASFLGATLKAPVAAGKVSSRPGDPAARARLAADATSA